MDVARSAGSAVAHRISPTLERWWANVLLRYARSVHPLPLSAMRLLIPAVAGVLSLVAIITWVLTLRSLGAISMAISVGFAGLPMLIAPVLGSDWVARQLNKPDEDPRGIDADAEEIAWGLVLVVIYRLRWLVIIALMMTPALVIGVLHVRVSDYQVWQQSASVLGTASHASRVDYLTPSGGIPYFRLVIQAFSTAVLLWTLLPVMATLGVTSALLLEEPILSDIAALIAGAIVLAMLIPLWEFLARTPVLGGPLELVRLLLLGAVIVGLSYVVRWQTIFNAGVIAQSHDASA